MSRLRDRVRVLSARLLPGDLRQRVRALQRRYRLQRPRVGGLDLGDLRRTAPVSRAFGLDRGQPVDRRYIEGFLARHAADVRGRVLEFGDDRYTRAFGGDRVERSDVLSVVEGTPGATIVADLADGATIPSDTFDCILCTQTLQMIYDVGAAVETLHRILRPGGVLLLTAGGIKPVGRREGIDGWGEYWSPTEQGLRRLLGDRFGPGNVEVTTYGNVLSAVAYLHGLAAEELSEEELDHRDPDYEVLLAARVVKRDLPPRGREA